MLFALFCPPWAYATRRPSKYRFLPSSGSPRVQNCDRYFFLHKLLSLWYFAIADSISVSASLSTYHPWRTSRLPVRNKTLEAQDFEMSQNYASEQNAAQRECVSWREAFYCCTPDSRATQWAPRAVGTCHTVGTGRKSGHCHRRPGMGPKQGQHRNNPGRNLKAGELETTPMCWILSSRDKNKKR